MSSLAAQPNSALKARLAARISPDSQRVTTIGAGETRKIRSNNEVLTTLRRRGGRGASLASPSRIHVGRSGAHFSGLDVLSLAREYMAVPSWRFGAAGAADAIRGRCEGVELQPGGRSEQSRLAIY